MQRLDSNGNFERAWGMDGTLDRPNALAVNPSNGDVYVVDSGDRRVVQFDIDGNPIRSWSLAVGNARGDYRDATVAIAPSPPHDVFVADQAHDRILQFDAEGTFLRAWGLGVASGARKFEVCATEHSCRVGRTMVRFTNPRAEWPSQIAVDAAGVVYGSVFFGSIFGGGQQPLARTKIVRFRSIPPPEDTDARDTLLSPMTPRPRDVYDDSKPDDFYLTDGTTLGMDVDPQTGSLFVSNNPFGPSKLDVVRRPGGGRTHSTKPLTTLPFLQNVNGLAVADGGQVILLASGTIHEPVGSSTFTGCARAHARHDCHGLIVLAPEGVPRAMAAPAPTDTAPTTLINPYGAARYRFQISQDGKTWRSLGRPRYVIGDVYEQIAPPQTGLRPRTLYRTRILIEKKAVEGVETTVAELGASMAPSS